MSALLRSLVTNLPSPRWFYKYCRLLIIQHFITTKTTKIIIIIISALDAAATTPVTTETNHDRGMFAHKI
jgi:hypothetical protein